jgi:Na+/H+ antiporter NhaD/arsenite permease-like protein
MSVGALESGGALRMLAQWLDSHLAVRELIPTVIGLASSVIDNVPLVAATMGMYELSQHPPDSELWQLIAYCAGTGGSILIIGSAAGVAYMGMEKVGFFWYLRNASLAALAGYFAGILVYISLHGDVLQRLFHQVF